jgi:hypothetical protein
MGGDQRGSTLLAVHPRASARGSWEVDGRHWDGLPDGTGRATAVRGADPDTASARSEPAHPLEALLTRSAASNVIVERRALATYDHASGGNRRADNGALRP